MIIYGGTFGIEAIRPNDVILFHVFSCCTSNKWLCRYLFLLVQISLFVISSYDVILFNMFSCCTLEQMVMYIFVNFSSDQFVCDKITLLIALLTLKRVS